MSYNPKNERPIIISENVLNAYSPKPNRYGLTFPSDSEFTKQEFKDECDINVLMSHYKRTGEIPNLNERAPQYLDVSGADFQQAMDFVAGAKSMFHEMPAHIRSRFENNPALFLDFCSQEKNRPEMAEMGLLKPVSEWISQKTTESISAIKEAFTPPAPAAAPAEKID